MSAPDWRAEYPFEGRFHELAGGARLHFLDEGRGEPVVALHGNPTWSFYWRRLVLGLRDRCRLLVPDHLGMGLSDKPPAFEYRLARHVENLEDLLGRLAPGPVTLVLHDWGGAIGMGWAVRHPELVRRIVVTNTAAFLGGRCPWRIRVCRWPVLGPLAVRGLNGFVAAATVMAVTRPLTAAVRAGYLHPYDSWANRVAVQAFVRDIPGSPRHPTWSVLAHIESRLGSLADKPMLLLWGMRDWCFTPDFLAGWTARFPRAEVQRLPDASHYVMEDAHEQVLPAVRDFLGRT